jgi:hypothetical protein
MDILLAGKSALPCFKQEQTTVFYVQRRFRRPVQNIPPKANAIPMFTDKVFGFVTGTAFALRAESRSPSHRNTVRLSSGTAFGCDRIHHRSHGVHKFGR